jgi:hypothetical protein
VKTCKIMVPTCSGHLFSLIIHSKDKGWKGEGERGKEGGGIQESEDKREEGGGSFSRVCLCSGLERAVAAAVAEDGVSVSSVASFGAGQQNTEELVQIISRMRLGRGLQHSLASCDWSGTADAASSREPCAATAVGGEGVALLLGSDFRPTRPVLPYQIETDREEQEKPARSAMAWAVASLACPGLAPHPTGGCQGSHRTPSKENSHRSSRLACPFPSNGLVAACLRFTRPSSAGSLSFHQILVNEPAGCVTACVTKVESRDQRGRTKNGKPRK